MTGQEGITAKVEDSGRYEGGYDSLLCAFQSSESDFYYVAIDVKRSVSFSDRCEGCLAVRIAVLYRDKFL